MVTENLSVIDLSSTNNIKDNSLKLDHLSLKMKEKIHQTCIKLNIKWVHLSLFVSAQLKMFASFQGDLFSFLTLVALHS